AARGGRRTGKQAPLSDVAVERTDPSRRTSPRTEKDQTSALGLHHFPRCTGQAWSSALSPLAFGSGLARQDEAWIGMIIYGNRQPCIGNLPKKLKMPSSNNNS